MQRQRREKSAFFKKKKKKIAQSARLPRVEKKRARNSNVLGVFVARIAAAPGVGLDAAQKRARRRSVSRRRKRVGASFDGVEIQNDAAQFRRSSDNNKPFSAKVPRGTSSNRHCSLFTVSNCRQRDNNNSKLEPKFKYFQVQINKEMPSSITWMTLLLLLLLFYGSTVEPARFQESREIRRIFYY